MHEFRRGGDNIDLPPHQAEVAEQTEHDINGGSLTYMWSDPSAENRVNAYVAMQDIKRKSYYGTGMDPNAYGHTSDFTVVTGVQYTHGFKKFLFLPSDADRRRRIQPQRTQGRHARLRTRHAPGREYHQRIPAERVENPADGHTHRRTYGQTQH